MNISLYENEYIWAKTDAILEAMSEPFVPPSLVAETIDRLIRQAVQADIETGSAQETRRARQVGWKIYGAWVLSNQIDMLTATGEDGETYLEHLEGIYNAPASILNRLAQVRTLYKFWHQLGLTLAEPFKGLSGPPNGPAARRRVFSAVEVKHLLKIRGNDDQALLLLGLRVGLKADALVALTWEQLDLNNNTICHADTEHPLTLDSSAGRVLRRLTTQRQAQGHSLEGKVFPDLRGPSDVDRQLRHLCTKAGIQKKNWPVLRNTAGVIQSGKSNLVTLQEVMEFKSLRSVMYLNEKRRYEEGEPVDNVRKARLQSRRRSIKL